MSTHESDGTSVCIHAVLVSSEYQRRGVAVAMIQEYIARLRKANAATGTLKYMRVLLLAHEELRSLYEMAGFRWDGRSEVVHGSRPWYEFRIELADSPPAFTKQAQSPRILEALQRLRPTTGSLPIPESFSDVQILSEPGENNTQTNKCNLVCLRNGCRSVILKRGVAELLEAPSVEVR